MTNHVQLDNVAHQNLSIITRHGDDLDDNISYTLVFPSEFRALQADYPLFFRQNGHNGQYEPIALLGLTEQENLLVDKHGWHAQTIPLTIERKPFLIGFEQSVENGQSVKNPVVHLDLDSPRVSQTEGEKVFLPHGGHSPYLNRINSVLKQIFQNGPQCKDFVDALVAFDLLEAFTLKVTLQDDSALRLGGFYTINEDKLNQLGGEQLAQLQSVGYLQHIYMMIASIANVAKLISLKNQRLASL